MRPTLAIGLLAALCILKLAVVPAFYDFTMPVGELPFGFGKSSAAVAATGSLWVCPESPESGICSFASRMPFIPYFYAAVSKLIGDHLLAITILKTLMLDGLLLYFLAGLLAIIGSDRFTLALFAAVLVGPQFMLHSTAPYYEEGFLVQLLAVLFVIQLIYGLHRESELPRWARLPGYLLASAGIYLLKSSMILVLAWNLVFLLCFTPLSARLRSVALVAICLPPLLWGAAVYQATGRFAIGTSIDGLNLVEGNNPVTHAFYPRYTVDIIIGDTPIELEGRMMERLRLADFDPRFAGHAWSSEWERDDAYRNIAITWAAGHLADELSLVALKLRVFLLEIRNSPIVPGHPKPPRIIELAGMAWMALMRIVMWSAIAVAVVAIWRGGRLRTAAACLLGFGACYTAPYIVGFAFERHVIPILLPAALFLAVAWRSRTALASES